MTVKRRSLRKNVYHVFPEVASGWRTHDVPSLAAALAFHASLSLAPLLLISVIIASTLFDQATVEAQIQTRLSELVGDEIAAAVGTILTSSSDGSSGRANTVGGMLILLISASGVFRQLRVSLNRIWDVEPGGEKGIRKGLVLAIARYLRAILMVLASGFLLLLSLTVNTLLSLPENEWAPYMPIAGPLQSILRWLVLPAILSIMFAAIMKALPLQSIAWRAIWPGALVTTAFFLPGQYLIGLYFARMSTGSMYGAAGALVVVLLWVYYSSIIFLFGAHFTRSYEELIGASQDKSVSCNADRGQKGGGN